MPNIAHGCVNISVQQQGCIFNRSFVRAELKLLGFIIFIVVAKLGEGLGRASLCLSMCPVTDHVLAQPMQLSWMCMASPPAYQSVKNLWRPSKIPHTLPESKLVNQLTLEPT